MKNLLITLVILIAVMASGQAQDKLKIGELKGSKLVITNPDALKAFFMNSLEKSGTLGKEFQVNTAPDGKRLFLYYPVSGNKNNVTNIGVLLVILDNGAFIVKGSHEIDSPGGGGSMTITCTGINCNACFINIQWSNSWYPKANCDCIGGSGSCDMTSTVTIGINL